MIFAVVKDVVFLWEKDNITFEGQDNIANLETEIKLRAINESLGLCTCRADNEIGDNECSFEVTEAVLRGNTLDPIIIFIVSIILAMLIVTGLAAVFYICCSRRNRHQDQGEAEMSTEIFLIRFFS